MHMKCCYQLLALVPCLPLVVSVYILLLQNMNTCPVDRSKFSSIKVYLHVNGKCTGEVSIIKIDDSIMVA